MKNLLLIDSGFSNNFWIKTMKTLNYLQNRPSTKSKNHGELISKET